MIKLHSISVTFGSTVALNDVSCSISEGDFVVVVGTNGSGKTTLFNVIAGTVAPDRGRITISGQDVTGQSACKRAPLVGRLFQNPLHNCVPSMTVAENIALALCKGRYVNFSVGVDQEVEDILDDIADLFHLSKASLRDKPMSALSGGQRQTVALVMATAVKPRLLLLDEPTAALDPQAATKLLTFAIEYIRRYSITTMMITHDPQLALSVGNKLWVLQRGELVRQVGSAERAHVSSSDLVGNIDYDALVHPGGKKAGG